MIRSLCACLSILLLLAACGDQEPKPEPTPEETWEAVETRSIALGGALYDKFWKVADVAEPKANHPLWEQRPDKTSNTRTGSTTWRCKECHGWDYKGVHGVYAGGSHKTGFPGVRGSKLTAEEMKASLKEAHGYGAAGFSDVALSSLVMFLTEGLVDTATWIDEQGAFRGDATKGKALYMEGVGGNKACRICHGLDGRMVPKGAPADYEDFVGKIATENPWEFLHKLRFGQPGTKMPAAHGTSATLQDLADLGAYSQTLPKER